MNTVYICILIKIPTTSYVNATIMRWGHDFLRISGGNIQNLWANGEKPNVRGRAHQTVNYLSCLIHPIIYYFQKFVGLVIAWDGQGMTTQIRIGEAIGFWETRFDSLGKQKPKNVGHSMMLPRFHVFLTMFPSRELSQAARTSCVSFHSTFFVVGFIFP